jgi:hypothetical protein
MIGYRVDDIGTHRFITSPRCSFLVNWKTSLNLKYTKFLNQIISKCIFSAICVIIFFIQSITLYLNEVTIVWAIKSAPPPLLSARLLHQVVGKKYNESSSCCLLTAGFLFGLISTLKMQAIHFPKRRWIYTEQHDLTAQETVILMFCICL